VANVHNWYKDDVEFDKELELYGMDADDIDGLNGKVKKPTRIFRAWLDQRDKDKKKKDHPLTEAKFLDKYGGMCWLDPDYDKIHMASDKSCTLIKGRTNG
jgi:hypothetical protein